MCVAGADAPLSERVLNIVVVFVERLVEWDFSFTVGFGQNAGLYTTYYDYAVKPIGIAALVTKQAFACGMASNVSAALS